jgi:hypothetical protein
MQEALTLGIVRKRRGTSRDPVTGGPPSPDRRTDLSAAAL